MCVCALPQVVSFAGELLKLAEELLKNGLHTAEVVTGYQRAYQKTMEILPTLVVRSIDNIRDAEELKTGIRSVLATKQFGYEDILSDLVVQATLTTLSPTAKVPKLNIDSVRIAKLKGGSLDQSNVIKGMVILRDAEGLIKRAENAKVAVFGCGIEAAATEAKGTVLLKSAEELLNYNKSEERKMEEVIESIAATGVKVVIANGSISEMAQHFLDKFEIMVVKIQSKFDLRRICGAVRATAAVRLGPPTPEEIGECSLYVAVGLLMCLFVLVMYADGWWLLVSTGLKSARSVAAKSRCSTKYWTRTRRSPPSPFVPRRRTC